MERVAALVVTLLVGGLVALQPPANALLSRLVGDLGAAFVSLLLSTVLVGFALIAVGEPAQLKGITAIRPEHLLGAIAGAAIVVVSLITVRSLGAGGVAAALVAMQLTVSAVLDRYGVLGLDAIPIGWKGFVGIALLLVGTLLVTSR